jgi:hypothetical protein
MKCYHYFSILLCVAHFKNFICCLLCLVGGVNLVFGWKGYQSNILFCFWSFAGGRGVAAGVKPEKCSRCKGLGAVSYARGEKSNHFYWDKNYCPIVNLWCCCLYR